MDDKTAKTNAFALGEGLAVLGGADREVHILNPLARWIWEAAAAGLDPVEIKALVAERTGVDGSLVEDLMAAWARDGLRPTPPQPADYPPCRHTYWLGGARIQVGSPQEDILAPLHACLAHLEDHQPGPLAACFSLTRTDQAEMVINRDGAELRRVDDLNDLIVLALWEIIEQACRIPGRLLTIHGGAVARKGFCCLVAGPGGCGKTTLLAGLAANGYTLVAEDVAPLDAAGGLLHPVPVSMCVKSGSWPWLTRHYPQAESLPVYTRYGKQVRFYPPPPTAVPDPTRRFRAQAVLFPAYRPEAEPRLTPLAPPDILAELQKGNSIVDSWEPDNLAAVTAWVNGLKGYRLVYRDLASGLALVDHLRAELS